MSILYRKLLRELQASRLLFALIAGIIAVGITCFVAMQSAYHNLDRAKAHYYQRSRMADFWVDLKKIPLSQVDRIANELGVGELRPRIQFQATVDLESVREPVNGIVLSLPDQRSKVVNDVILRQGDYFTGRNRYEVLVNEKFARAHNLYPGQRVRLLLNNRRMDLLIVGTAISSEFTYLVGPGALLPDPAHFGVFYITRTLAEEVFDFEGAANQLVGRVAPNAADRLPETLRRLEQHLEPYGVFTTTALEDQVSNQFLSNEIDGLGATAAVLPVVFLIVAALVLNVLVSRLARRQRTVVGTLKALGYGDGQVFLHFLMFSLGVGVLGGLAGSILGYLSATGMTEVYATFFEFPELESGFYWYTHGIGLTVSVLCSTAGGLHAARQMLKLQAAEAMRPEPPRQGGVILLERLLGSTWHRLDIAWRMPLRSMFRNRLRTATGMFAATMGSALLVSGFMMSESQNYLIDFQFFREARSDIDLVFKDEMTKDAIAELKRLPGVILAEPTLGVAGTFQAGPYQRKGAITGLLSDARLTTPCDVDGRPIRLPEAGLVLTRRLAEKLHVEVGDHIRLVPVKGEQFPIEATVAVISDSFMGLAAYADIRYLSPRYRAMEYQSIEHPGCIEDERIDESVSKASVLLTVKGLFPCADFSDQRERVDGVGARAPLWLRHLAAPW